MMLQLVILWCNKRWLWDVLTTVCIVTSTLHAHWRQSDFSFLILHTSKRKNSKDVLCSQNTVVTNRPSSWEPFVLLCHNNDPPDEPYFPQASGEKADIKPVQATDDQSESYEESDPDGAARTSQLDQGIQFENGRGLPDGQYEQDEPRKLICFVVVFNRNLCRCLLLRAT